MLRVTDIKQYFYCPRILYYNYCMPAPRVVTHPMQIGVVRHEVLSVFERRRSLKRYGIDTGERTYHVMLEATMLGLSGVIDMLIVQKNQAFPVEFKDTDQRMNLNAKYQITAYAMMVEECLGKKVNYGFFYRIPKAIITPVPITPALQKKTKKSLQIMYALIREERLPAPTPHRTKCVECEFKRFCRDVL